jgi:hypothetical protein
LRRIVASRKCESIRTGAVAGEQEKDDHGLGATWPPNLAFPDVKAPRKRITRRTSLDTRRLATNPRLAPSDVYMNGKAVFWTKASINSRYKHFSLRKHTAMRQMMKTKPR